MKRTIYIPYRYIYMHKMYTVYPTWLHFRNIYRKNGFLYNVWYFCVINDWFEYAYVHNLHIHYQYTIKNIYGIITPLKCMNYNNVIDCFKQ